MPLTGKVTFSVQLKGRSTLLIPKLIRWRFRMENNQVLKIGVNFSEAHRGWQFFYAKMHKDGRITVPKLTLQLTGIDAAGLVGQLVEVMVEPA